MKQVTIELLDNDGFSAGLLKLDEEEALKLLGWFIDIGIGDSNGCPMFYEGETENPWRIGRAYIPDDFSTEEFWDKSNGREIAEKYHLDDTGKYYYFTLDEYEKLKSELQGNPYWFEFNGQIPTKVLCNIELEIVDANGEV